MVWLWQLLDQVSDVVHPLLVVAALWSREAAVRRTHARGTATCRHLVAKIRNNSERRLTDGVDKVREGSVGEERLGELPEEHLEGSCGDVDVLPLGVIQIHLLVYTGGRDEERERLFTHPL